MIGLLQHTDLPNGIYAWHFLPSKYLDLAQLRYNLFWLITFDFHDLSSCLYYIRWTNSVGDDLYTKSKYTSQNFTRKFRSVGPMSVENSNFEVHVKLAVKLHLPRFAAN